MKLVFVILNEVKNLFMLNGGDSSLALRMTSTD